MNVGMQSPVKQLVYGKTQFNSTVDDILFRSTFTSVQEAPKSNMKRKNQNIRIKNIVHKYQPVTGCLSNKWGKCKARFPWQDI